MTSKRAEEVARQLLSFLGSDHARECVDGVISALESYAEEKVEEVKTKKLEWAATAIDKAVAAQREADAIIAMNEPIYGPDQYAIKERIARRIRGEK